MSAEGPQGHLSDMSLAELNAEIARLSDELGRLEGEDADAAYAPLHERYSAALSWRSRLL